MKALTPKQRMLHAYRGIPNDRLAVAPEFWYYVPAKLLGVDLIEFEREVPFHLGLKHAFETFGCEGWGVVMSDGVPADAQVKKMETWIHPDCLETLTETRTPFGTIRSRQRYDRHEPSWTVERPIKEPDRDLPVWLYLAMPDPTTINISNMNQAWRDVGESYLLEVWLGLPFFDFYATAREGGLEQGIFDFLEHPSRFENLQRRYIEYLVHKARVLCERTPFESFCIGCIWSCNSLIGPAMWRRWDKPVIAAVAEELHRNKRLLHIHFHGKCMETVADFAEMGVDCVCPFERPPGGDIDGLEGLRRVAKILENRTTMNGNVHTVETLIRGSPDDVRREVREILEAFEGNPRVIVGTGDQVGRETPEENLYAMIEEAHRH